MTGQGQAAASSEQPDLGFRRSDHHLAKAGAASLGIDDDFSL
jgi:hypothetical protein